MDAFRTLTGGVRFQKKYALDFDTQPKKYEPVASSSALPAALDFFDTSIPTDTMDRALLKKQKKRRRAEEAAAASAVAAIDYPAFLRQHKIKCTGLEVPHPVISWADLTRSQAMSVAMSGSWDKMGMRDPTAIQMAAWGVMLEKRDILACAPTGSGKTLAFIVPLLIMNPPSPAPPAGERIVCRPTSLILEPTRELSMQVCREVVKLGEGGEWVVKVLGEDDRAKNGPGKAKGKWRRKLRVKKAAVELKEGEASEEESESEEEAEEEEAEEEVAENAVDDVEVAAVDGVHADILITTPLRLVFAVKAGTVDLSNVRHLILDEADKLFELNFIEQTDDIITACSHPDLRKGMFSATLSSGTEELAKSVMSGGGVGLIRVIVGQKDAATETIAQSLTFVGTEDHKLLSLRTLITEGWFTPPVLIFVQSITRAKELATELLFDGINADCIHADRTPSERDDVVRGFAEGKIWCLIATDLMGRGLDFKGVRLVINYDFPQDGGSYIHRIGRTGRAGKEGRAITFFTKADAPHLKSIVNVMRTSGCEVPPWMLELKNPSQKEKKKLKMRPVARKDVSRTSGSGDGAKGDRKRVKRTRVMGGVIPVKGKKPSAKDVTMDE